MPIHFSVWPRQRSVPARDPQRPLLFLHIPKSAGSSLAEGLQAAIHPQTVVRGFDTSVFGAFDAFSGMAPAIAAHVYGEHNLLPAPADFVAGHFGYHHLMAAYPQGQLITILREPVSRLLSLWLFWRGHEETDLAGWGDWTDRVQRARNPLGAFLSDPDLYCQTDNITVRMLLSPDPRIPLRAPIAHRDAPALLKAAQGVLDRLAFADVVENSAMAQRLQDWLGEPFHLSCSNATPPVPAERRGILSREMNEETLALLESRSRLDRVLWRALVRRRLPGTDPDALERSVLLRNCARTARLLAGNV